MIHLTYPTERYNSAIRGALAKFPERPTSHILLCEKYYVHNTGAITQLLADYRDFGNENAVIGGAIWARRKTHIRRFISYYDTLSVKELRGVRYHEESELPSGLKKVSGVGCCWIFPLNAWEKSGGFAIPKLEPQAGGSRCLSSSPKPVMLDCSARFWRTPADIGVPDYSPVKRIRVSLGEQRRKLWKW